MQFTIRLEALGKVLLLKMLLPELPGGLPPSSPRSSPRAGGDLCRCAPPPPSETGDGCPIRVLGVGISPDHLTK